MLPSDAGTLISADVDVAAGEDIAHLREHLLEELHGAWITGTQHIVGHSPYGPNLIGTARASQFGIYAQGCHHVPREVYLGDDVDVAFCGIPHDVAHLLLGVVAASPVLRVVVEIAVLAVTVATYHRLLADAGLGSQFRHGFHLEAPSLVVGDVPVELVDAVQGQYVDEGLDVFGIEEVAGHIQVLSAVRKASLVINDGVGEKHLLAVLDGQTLA